MASVVWLLQPLCKLGTNQADCTCSRCCRNPAPQSKGASSCTLLSLCPSASPPDHHHLHPHHPNSQV